MVISDEELSKKPCARVHALRVGVVLRRYELGAVAAKEGEQKVRHGREAVDVLSISAKQNAWSLGTI